MHHIASDWQKATLSTSDQALCNYAVKLTRTPELMIEDDILTLRQCGFNDRAIHDTTQVISYFNYINRMADALNVEQEDFIRAWEHSPSWTSQGE